MKDFFREAKEAGYAAANITLMLTMTAGYEVVRGAENVARRLTGKTNGMTDEVKDTANIHLGDFKDAIVIPQLSKADKKWAKRMKSANSYEIAQELKDACVKGDNARVLHLINQPLRDGPLFSRTTYGFHPMQNMGHDAATHAAAAANNVGALYLLLAFAEKNDRSSGVVAPENPAKYIEDRVASCAFRALRSSAADNATDTTRFLAAVIGDFNKAYRDRGEAWDLYLANAVEDMIRHKRTDLLDMLLQKGTRAETFRQAIEMTFECDMLSGGQIVSDEARIAFLAWAQDRKVVDGAFAAMIEERMKEEQRAIIAAKKSGFYYMPASGSKRWFSRSDNHSLSADAEVNYKRIDEEKVVATLRERSPANSIALEFNFVTRKAKVDGKECSFEDFRREVSVGGEIVAVAEKDWKEHQTLRRPLKPRVRAKVVKFDGNT